MKKRKKKDEREEKASKQILEFKKSAEKSKDKRAIRAARWLTCLEKTEELTKRKSKKFHESIKTLSNIERAEKWLCYVVDNIEVFGDTEALVYLVSRGYNCKNEIENVIDVWRRSTKAVMDEAKAEYISKMKRAGIDDITNISPFVLRDFWSGGDYDQDSIDATMLRTVEWCKIGGFDEWWKRLAKQIKMDIIQGGFLPYPGIFWLFNMCRSDLAVELMKDDLLVAFHSVLLTYYGEKFPWKISREYIYKDKRKFDYFDNYLYCGQLVFCNYMLKENSNKDLIKNALNLILKSQNIEQGYWTLDEGHEGPNIETTAVNIHALCLERPRGWERAVEKAKKWLWSVQKQDGFWYEESCPDPVYLTVLVLDAIELADGGSFVTFSKKWVKRNINTGNGDKVLLLGKDTDEGLERLKMLEDILLKFNYKPIIIKEQPDKIEQSSIQKVIEYAAMSKFVIIENTEPSGHLYEFPYIEKMKYTTIVLQEEGKGSTWMLEDLYPKLTCVKKFTYNLSSLEESIRSAVDWAENYIKSYGKYRADTLPWL